MALPLNEVQNTQLCGPRSVYLITYSQADLSTFSTRESFAQAIVEKFRSHGAEVTRWACCKENHVEEEVHYHLAEISSNCCEPYICIDACLCVTKLTINCM